MAGSTKQAEEQRQKNREIILNLMRSTYFLAKNCILHSTIYMELIKLQVLAMNCMKNFLVKGDLKLSTHRDSVLGC